MVQDLQVPPSLVETQSLASISGGTKSIRFLYQDAELFFFAVGDTVYGVQFGKAVNPDALATADEGQQIVGIDGGTSDWYWAEGSYDQMTGRVPCNNVGALNWHLVPSNPNWMTAPAFEYSRVRFCSAPNPMFAMDGDNIAVAVEAPRDNHPQAWDIRLMSTFNGTVLRTVETDRDVFSLDLSGQDIAYIEGDYDDNVDPNFAFNTHLMLSTVNHPEPVEAAKDAYEVSFGDSRLAWISDPQLSQRDDNAPATSLMTASADDVTPQTLATDPGATGSTPVASGSYVTWSAGGQVFLWDANSNVTSRIHGTGDAGQPSDHGGWLTWVSDDTDGVQSLNAVELDKLFPPAPTPTPKPTPPATPLPSATFAQPETINVNGIEWKRFEHDALPNLRFVGDVTETAGRFLVIGSRCAYPLPDYAGGCGTSDVLLSSSDGTNWTELGTVGGQPGDDASNFYEDTRGWFASGSEGYDTPVPGIWHSVDNGLNWDFLANPWADPGECVGKYGAGIGQIFPDGADLIAIGSGIWHSGDGLTWTCVGPVPRLVITYAHGTFVGEGSGSVTSSAEAFWQSGDGVAWQKTQKAPLNTSIASVADGFVALGGGDRYAPTSLLTSTDGRSWTPQPYPFGIGDVGLVNSNGNRALVIETDYSTVPGEVEPGAVWISSTDGSTWTRYQLPARDGDDAQSAAFIGDKLVVTGSSYNNGNSDGSGVIWSAQIP